MKKPRIVRVWGKADNFDIEFKKSEKSGGKWLCAIPPDTKDGQYATEIFGINEYGEKAYWTGILYMCGGVCHLEIMAQPFTFWLSERRFSFVVEEPNYVIIIKKGCEHVL